MDDHSHAKGRPDRAKDAAQKKAWLKPVIVKTPVGQVTEGGGGAGPPEGGSPYGS